MVHPIKGDMNMEIYFKFKNEQDAQIILDALNLDYLHSRLHNDYVYFEFEDDQGYDATIAKMFLWQEYAEHSIEFIGYVLHNAGKVKQCFAANNEGVNIVATDMCGNPTISFDLESASFIEETKTRLRNYIQIRERVLDDESAEVLTGWEAQ